MRLCIWLTYGIGQTWIAFTSNIKRPNSHFLTNPTNVIDLLFCKDIRDIKYSFKLLNEAILLIYHILWVSGNRTRLHDRKRFENDYHKIMLFMEYKYIYITRISQSHVSKTIFYNSASLWWFLKYVYIWYRYIIYMFIRSIGWEFGRAVGWPCPFMTSLPVSIFHLLYCDFRSPYFTCCLVTSCHHLVQKDDRKWRHRKVTPPPHYSIKSLFQYYFHHICGFKIRIFIMVKSLLEKNALPFSQ